MEITNLAIFSTLLGNRSTFWCMVSEFPTKPLVLFSSNAVWDKNPTPTNRFRYQELIPAYCPEWPGSWVASWEKFHVDRLMVRFMGYPNRERFGATPRFRWNTSWVRSFYMLGRSFLAVLKCFFMYFKAKSGVYMIFKVVGTSHIPSEGSWEDEFPIGGIC